MSRKQHIGAQYISFFAQYQALNSLLLFTNSSFPASSFPDDASLHTLADCFQASFNHLAELGHAYLAPLTLLYLAAILRGRMLSSNNPSPPALCDHQCTGPLQPLPCSPGCSTGGYGQVTEESIPPCFTAWNYRDNPKESFLVLRTLYSPSKSGKLIGLTALTAFSLGKKKWHYFSTQTF